MTWKLEDHSSSARSPIVGEQLLTPLFQWDMSGKHCPYWRSSWKVREASVLRESDDGVFFDLQIIEWKATCVLRLMTSGKVFMGHSYNCLLKLIIYNQMRTIFFEEILQLKLRCSKAINECIVRDPNAISPVSGLPGLSDSSSLPLSLLIVCFIINLA